MDAERFHRAKEIFGDLLDLPSDRRLDFATDRCGDNHELLNEIIALLNSHNEAEDFIEKSVFESVSDFVLNDQELKLSGKQIGPYRVLRQIGRGGMGAVYLCERTEEFRKQVAVKLIKRGLDTDDIIRRFERERQILAALDHPHIARLIDGGATDDGLPYLVMDYVEGIPVTEYCAENNPSTEEILKLFQKICAAVAYAHQNLIVHRDVKPTNILVSADGTPKLLDFGIAKLVADGDGDTLTAFTQTRHAMTPEYASPEQLEGERVTTATDIYSLGVVLHELLTGARPTAVSSRPSFDRISSASGKQTNRDTAPKTKFPKGDLGKILAMALRKEPERRYSSVDQFATDIKRFLTDLPVVAQADSISYRAEKFVRRNKVPVAAGIGVLCSLVGGIVATSRQSRRARSQRDKAQKVSEFLQKTLASPDPRIAGKDIKFTEVLSGVAETIDADFAGQPDVAAGLHTTVGMTFLGLGILDLAEKHLKKALEIRLTIFPRNSSEVASSLTHYGRILREKGDMVAAEPLLVEAYEILNNRRFEGTLELADALNAMGYLCGYKSDHEAALGMFRRELAIRRSRQGRDHTDLARALNETGNILRLAGRTGDAESLHREALGIVHKNYGSVHPDVAETMTKVSDSIYSKHPQEAEDLCREALRIRQLLLGDDHASTAWSYYKLAYVLISRQMYAEADDCLKTVLSKTKSGLPEFHMVIHSSYVLWGRSMAEQKRFLEARPAIEESLRLRRATLPDDHWMIAVPSVFLGECLMHLGEPLLGKKLVLDNFAIVEEKLGTDHELTEMLRTKIAFL